MARVSACMQVLWQQRGASSGSTDCPSLLHAAGMAGAAAAGRGKHAIWQVFARRTARPRSSAHPFEDELSVSCEHLGPHHVEDNDEDDAKDDGDDHASRRANPDCAWARGPDGGAGAGVERGLPRHSCPRGPKSQGSHCAVLGETGKDMAGCAAPQASCPRPPPQGRPAPRRRARAPCFFRCRMLSLFMSCSSTATITAASRASRNMMNSAAGCGEGALGGHGGPGLKFAREERDRPLPSPTSQGPTG